MTGPTTGPPVLRFAPSPNGPLHLGHALSALVGFDMARRLGGRFLVRIEDIDVARCREEHVRRHLRGSRLARHHLGGARAAPVAALRRLCAGRAVARSAGPALSVLCLALGDPGSGQRAARSIPKARRSTPACTSGSPGPRSRSASATASASPCASTWSAHSRRPPAGSRGAR